MCVNHGQDAGTNVTWRNNIMHRYFDDIQGSSSFASGSPNYNWCLTETCAGANSLNGAPAPSWVGGVSPVTFAGYALTGGSRGTGVASDGTNIGVNP